MKRELCFALALLFAAGTGAEALIAKPQDAATQTEQPASSEATSRRAEIYYDLTLGHLYAQDYLDSNNSNDASEAIDYYKEAYALDPTSQVIGEELAETYFASQRTQEAVTEAQALLQSDPDNLPARRLLARIYIRSLGDATAGSEQQQAMQQAIVQLKEIVRRDPTDAESALWLARLDRLDNQPDQAEQVLRSILAGDPEDEGATDQLSQLLLDENKSDEAVALLEMSLASAPEPSATLYDRLGDAYAQKHDPARAEQAYRRAAEIEPDRTSHLHGLAQALFDQKKYPEAAGIYQRLVAAEPNDASNYLRLSETYTQMRQFDKAEQAVLLAKQHAPNDLEVIYDEATLYEAEGRYDDAIHVTSDAVASINSQAAVAPTRRRTLAILYQLLGQLDREDQNYTSAISTYQELAKLGPDEDRRARPLLIDAYRADRDLTHALEEAKRSVADYPKDLTLKITQAGLYGDNGQPEQAAQILQPLLNHSSDDLEIELELVQIYTQSRQFDQAQQAIDAAEKLGQQPMDQEIIDFLRGDLYAREKEYPEAEQMFEGALAINPRNASALNYYAYLLADSGVRLDDAAAMLKRALDEEPNNAAFLDSMGWTYYKQNKLPEAEAYIRKAVSHESHDPNMLSHLGDVLMKLGQSDMASVEWEKALTEWHRVPPAEYEAGKVTELEQKLSNLKNHVAQQTAPNAGSQ